MKIKDKRLTILSEIEEFAFYGLPDFDNEQRATYFTFTQEEIDLICRCREFHAQVYCAIQIGYFKAKHMFFQFSLNRIPKEDIHFILTRYFENRELITLPITKNEYYFQRTEILKLFGYVLWGKPHCERSDVLRARGAQPLVLKSSSRTRARSELIDYSREVL